VTTSGVASERAAHVPGIAEKWKRPVRLTALYHQHVAWGAELVERDGWLIPHSYGDVEAERAALRRAAGLLDISESGKVDLRSDDVDGVLAEVFTDVGSVEVGNVASVDAGATRLCRLTNDQALILVAPKDLQGILDWLGRVVAERHCAHVTDISSGLCGVRLLGPTAPSVLERLSWLDLAPDRFGNLTLAQGAVAKVHALVARRDAAGFPGYDLYVDRDLGAYMWECLLAVGAPLGVRPVGRVVEEVT
jgi:glycine cleavage system aminomethyltransferase T